MFNPAEKPFISSQQRSSPDNAQQQLCQAFAGIVRLRGRHADKGSGALLAGFFYALHQPAPDITFAPTGTATKLDWSGEHPVFNQLVELLIG